MCSMPLHTQCLHVLGLKNGTERIFLDWEFSGQAYWFSLGYVITDIVKGELLGEECSSTGKNKGEGIGLNVESEHQMDFQILQLEKS